MKTTEQWLAGYVEVPPGEEKEGDVVIVGTTELPVYLSQALETLWARHPGGDSVASVEMLRSLGCPVLRKREPLVWEGVVYVNEYGRMMPASCGVMPQEFSRKRVRIEEKL